MLGGRRGHRRLDLFDVHGAPGRRRRVRRPLGRRCGARRGIVLGSNPGRSQREPGCGPGRRGGRAARITPPALPGAALGRRRCIGVRGVIRADGSSARAIPSSGEHRPALHRGESRRGGRADRSGTRRGEPAHWSAGFDRWRRRSSGMGGRGSTRRRRGAGGGHGASGSRGCAVPIAWRSEARAVDVD